MSADTQPAAAPGPCARCGHSEREHTWDSRVGLTHVGACAHGDILPREGYDDATARYRFCECAAYTPQEPPVTQPDEPVTIAARDESPAVTPTEAAPVTGVRAAPYPESDLASRLSRALDAKTELEIRVARLEAMVNYVKEEHWNDDGMCDSCQRFWPCPTLIGLSAKRTSGE